MHRPPPDEDESSALEENRRLARALEALVEPIFVAQLELARLRVALSHAPPEVAARLNHLSEALEGVFSLEWRLIDELRRSAPHLGIIPAAPGQGQTSDPGRAAPPCPASETQ